MILLIYYENLMNILAKVLLFTTVGATQ